MGQAEFFHLGKIQNSKSKMYSETLWYIRELHFCYYIIQKVWIILLKFDHLAGLICH